MFDQVYKRKETKIIIVKNTNVTKAVMFCCYNYATDTETIKFVKGLVATLGGTLLTYLSNT